MKAPSSKVDNNTETRMGSLNTPTRRKCVRFDCAMQKAKPNDQVSHRQSLSGASCDEYCKIQSATQSSNRVESKSLTEVELNEIKKRVRERARTTQKRRAVKKSLRLFEDQSPMDAETPSSVSPFLDKQTASPDSEGHDVLQDHQGSRALLRQMRRQMQVMALQELNLLNKCKALGEKRELLVQQYKAIEKFERQRQKAKNDCPGVEDKDFVLPPSFLPFSNPTW